MTFISTKKPLSEWKWYVRRRDFSIHQSPDEVTDGVEVTPPPNPKTHTWDWENNQWMFNTADMKRRAQIIVEEEVGNLVKFFLIDEETHPRRVALRNYVESLKNYVVTLKEGDEMPTRPSILQDNEFFK